MMDQQVDLSKIPTWMVPFDHPFCVKHGQPHRIHTTRRKEIGTTIEAVRYHHCEKCKSEGGDEPSPLVNRRDFKNDPMG